MSRLRYLLFGCSLAFVTGCMTLDSPSEIGENACGAAEFQQFVGKPLSSFKTEDLSGRVRVIGPNTAVTLDYHADRLNVRHNTRHIITDIFCG